MEKYAHPEKKSELLWIVVKGWGCGWENVVLDVKIGKTTGKSAELSTKHPQFEKIAVDNKKIPGKKWGISCE